MGTTDSGMPYPEPSADLRLGADDIKALAQAVPFIQQGQVSASYSGLASFGHYTQAVVFPVPFPSPPTFVDAQKKAVITGSGAVMVSAITSVTATGCNIILTNLSATAQTASNVPLGWVAILP